MIVAKYVLGEWEWVVEEVREEVQGFLLPGELLQEVPEDDDGAQYQ